MFTISFNNYQYKIRYPINRDSVVLSHTDGTKDPWWMYVWASGIALSSFAVEQNINGKSVLEVGPGLGLASIVLKKQGNDVSVHDINPDILPYLLLNSQENEVQMPTWVESLESDPNTYDVVVSSDVMYNIHKIPQLVSSMFNKMKETGKLIICEPDRPMMIRNLEKTLTDQNIPFSVTVVTAVRGDAPTSDESNTIKIYTIQKEGL